MQRKERRLTRQKMKIKFYRDKNILSLVVNPNPEKEAPPECICLGSPEFKDGQMLWIFIDFTTKEICVASEIED